MAIQLNSDAIKVNKGAIETTSEDIMENMDMIR
jgi:hypothetical protein